jgi:putative transposase
MAVTMSRTGNCWDNAVAENFSATLKSEFIHRRPWPKRQSTIDVINAYMALFYNSSHRHWFTGGLNSVNYQRAVDNRAAQAA